MRKYENIDRFPIGTASEKLTKGCIIKISIFVGCLVNYKRIEDNAV